MDDAWLRRKLSTKSAARFPSGSEFDGVVVVTDFASDPIPGLQLISELGRGSTARVWAARDEQGQEVAVKIFTDAAASQRAFDEAGVLAAISHPNVINIHAVHRRASGIAIVMDRCALTLQDLVTSHGGLRGAQTVGLVQQICRGLTALHAAGLVHGDISPANVGVTRDGVAQLLDFSGSRDQHTLGTPGFSQREDVTGRGAAASKNPIEVERRMRRLLGAAQEREISLPGGMERVRGDVLATARVGLYALAGGAAGSVVATVAEILEGFISRLSDGGQDASPRDLERAVGAVIPAAPIDLPPLRGQLDQPPLAVASTRRAETGSNLDTSPGAQLWGEYAGGAARSEGGEQQEADRPRSPRRRHVLLGAMIAAGLAAIGGGIAIGTAENARSEEVIADRTDVVDAPPDAGAAALAQWQRRVSDLGQQRDLALVTGDRSHLTRVNAPGSAAEAADAQLLADLQAHAVTVTDFATQSTVREILNTDPPRVLLAVDTQVVLDERQVSGEAMPSTGLSAARITTDANPHSVEMELVEVAGQWLVSEIRKSRDTT